MPAQRGAPQRTDTTSPLLPSAACRLQFRRMGLMVWPRSKRLHNCVQSNPALHILRLNAMLVRAA